MKIEKRMVLKGKEVILEMSWYIKVMKNYFNFNGRARRIEYWMFYWYYFLFALVAAILDGVLGTASIFIGINMLAHMIPLLAVTVRRLHDIGKSGWWFLIGFIPLGNIVLLVFTFLDSGEDNKYGPNPKKTGEIVEEENKKNPVEKL